MTRWFSLGIPGVIASGLVIVAATPSLRSRVRDAMVPAQREILATVEGDALNDGTTARVIKFRDRRGIFVEVWRETKDGVTDVIDRIALPDRRDGLFNVRQRATRLAIVDIDQDGTFEIVAPSFDNQLVPHLNVFRYNPALARFEPVHAGSSAME